LSSYPGHENLPLPTVGALLRLAWQAFRQQMYTRVRAAGYDDLPPSHVLLFRYPTIADLRPSQLAEQMGMSKQGVNDLLRQLEAKGYIALRPDPVDGRARLITLTDRGSALMGAIRTAAQHVAAEWARCVGHEQFEVFRGTLVRLAAEYGPQEAGASCSAEPRGSQQHC
jgi:DNA-binding MarR family transcriptional regulator